MNITSKEKRIINIVRDLNVGECGEQPEVENMHHRFQEIYFSCAVDINMASCEGIIGSLVKKNILVKESAEKDIYKNTFYFSEEYLQGGDHE